MITITFLEMTSPDLLRRAAEPPSPLRLDLLGLTNLDQFREVCLGIGEPHGWTTRPSWERRQWAARLEAANVEVWLASTGANVVGLVELEFQERGNVEIVVFGLLPKSVGRGFGGPLLTRAVERAWDAPRTDGESTRRVWLHTSSYDHPHALPNYLKRGFRVERVERRSSGG